MRRRRWVKFVAVIGIMGMTGGCGFRQTPEPARASDHKRTAIMIGPKPDCEDVKEQTVNVKKNGTVEWYVTNECSDYEDGKIVTIQFVDDHDQEIAPPTNNGNCPNCRDKLKNNGFVKLSLHAKDLKDPTVAESYRYKVWIGDDKNPYGKSLTDPRLEIDP
jgi:hypothetical protein